MKKKTKTQKQFNQEYKNARKNFIDTSEEKSEELDPNENEYR